MYGIRLSIRKAIRFDNARYATNPPYSQSLPAVPYWFSIWTRQGPLSRETLRSQFVVTP